MIRFTMNPVAGQLRPGEIAYNTLGPMGFFETYFFSLFLFL